MEQFLGSAIADALGSAWDKRARVMIHTDGACLGNPGPGGYAAVLSQGVSEISLSGGFRRTTNNRMELLAVIAGLDAAGEGQPVRVISDSRYVVDAINEGWAKSWKSKGWMRGRKNKALNPDLWDWLLRLLADRDAEFVWIKGHSGDAGNERADALASAVAEGDDLGADEPFETETFEIGGATHWTRLFGDYKTGDDDMSDDDIVLAANETAAESIDSPEFGEWRQDGSDGVVCRMVGRGLVAEVQWAPKTDNVRPYICFIGGIKDLDSATNLCALVVKLGVVAAMDGDIRYFDRVGGFGGGCVGLTVSARYWRDVYANCWTVGIEGFIFESDAKTVAEGALRAAADNGYARA